MKTKERISLQVIEKKEPKIISQLTKSIEKVIDHKTLEEIMQLTEEER